MKKLNLEKEDLEVIQDYLACYYASIRLCNCSIMFGFEASKKASILVKYITELTDSYSYHAIFNLHSQTNFEVNRLVRNN